MNAQRINELKETLDNESISYGEIVEIDNAATELGIEINEQMTSIDMLLAIEATLC